MLFASPLRQSVLVLLALLAFEDASAEQSLRGPTISIQRARGAITVDGDLSDPGWKDATRVAEWYETNPGDNITPKVGSVAYLTYDDKFFYAAFEFSDPEPQKIRAPFADRDNVSMATDYGGVILDPRNDGKTGLLLLSNPRGIQYDAVTNDATGNEDSSPDFFWDSSARINGSGWVLEMRVPFSSLRYPKADTHTWGLLLYRNYPRDFRYQMFSSKLPRGGNCFICNENTLVGLTDLPSGGNYVVAPYASAKRDEEPRDALGSPLVTKPVEGTGGLDAKWTPNAVTALDLTINPDFSQVEADVAQISANERFALFFPEKRPFFLEGIELLSTPIQAVYTRTITSPRWGVRGTGKVGDTAYTVLVTEDDGGGSVVLPRPLFSELADQDFRSTVAIARARHDRGNSFVSFLVTDREVKDGGHNRVGGPDFQWRPNASNSITGQLLVSDTVTPDRPELAAEWDGRKLTSHAGSLSWSYNTETFDLWTQYLDLGDDFRADVGFVPQVGFRENYLEPGYTFRPTGFVRRVRTFFVADYVRLTDNRLLSSTFGPGVGMDAKWNSFLRFQLMSDKVRTPADEVIERRRLVYVIQANPSLRVSQLYLEGNIGEQIDFANSRPGHGGLVSAGATIRPTNHLELVLNGDRSWVDVRPDGGGPERRLFTATVERLKATYTFNARCFLRLIGQYATQELDPSLFTFPVGPKDESFSASALFSFKLNWQSVLFLGYGDDRQLGPTGTLEPADRQLFLKLSYAIQG